MDFCFVRKLEIQSSPPSIHLIWISVGTASSLPLTTLFSYPPTSPSSRIVCSSGSGSVPRSSPWTHLHYLKSYMTYFLFHPPSCSIFPRGWVSPKSHRGKILLTSFWCRHPCELRELGTVYHICDFCLWWGHQTSRSRSLTFKDLSWKGRYWQDCSNLWSPFMLIPLSSQIS